jgi:hypothetical protein
MFRRFMLPVLALVVALTVVAVGTRDARADPRDFTLINGTDGIIKHVYVQPSSPDDDWGDDVLGVAVLAPGESVFIYFRRFTPGNCSYDIKVVLDDGREGELLAVDLCSTDTVTFHN